MEDALQTEASRLKREYGPAFYDLIDRNLSRVTTQMNAAPGSIASEEGEIALSDGLPSRPRSHSGKAQIPGARMKDDFRKRSVE